MTLSWETAILNDLSITNPASGPGFWLRADTEQCFALLFKHKSPKHKYSHKCLCAWAYAHCHNTDSSFTAQQFYVWVNTDKLGRNHKTCYWPSTHTLQAISQNLAHPLIFLNPALAVKLANHSKNMSVTTSTDNCKTRPQETSGKWTAS